MEDYQQRVIEEHKQLDDKLVKLGIFISREAFKVLPEEERDRMLRQQRYMKRYSEVLAERIAEFKP